MKTEQEQIKELTQFMLEVSNSANVEPVFVDENGEEMRLNKGAASLLNDILEQAFIPYLAQKLIENGYGDVSKYKKRLKQSEDNFLVLTTKDLDLTREKEKLKAEIAQLKYENTVLYEVKSNLLEENDKLLKDNVALILDKKQAQIDVLNKAKEKLEDCTGCYIPNCFESPTDDFAYDAKEVKKIIDEIIKELQEK